MRRAPPLGATVLIIGAVADEEVLDPLVRTVDVTVLAITGGRERTVAVARPAARRRRLPSAGILPTPSPLRIVEAIAV